VRGLLEREGVFSWLMLAPGVLFLLAFVAYPFFYGIFLSLQDRRVARPASSSASPTSSAAARRGVLAGHAQHVHLPCVTTSSSWSAGSAWRWS
jgi:ABC-type sugar transport system permease subunit